MTKDDFIICVKNYTPNLLRFAKHSAGIIIEAADIVQECFEILWQNRDNVEMKSAKSFLFSVAHRKIVDTYRKDIQTIEIETADDMVYSFDSSQDNIQLVQIAMNKLHPLYKELLTLRDLESYSYKEIGEITHLPEARVKVYLFRARKAIKQKILQLEIQ